jgi:hypothetical protein
MSRWQTDLEYAARSIVSDLKAQGIEIPQSILDAYERFEAITIPPDWDDTELVQAQAQGRPQEEIDTLALQGLLRPTLRAAAAKAKIVAARNVLREIRAAAPHLFYLLRPLAEEVIADIHAAAQIGDVPLPTLISTGRIPEAELHANFETNMTVANGLFRLKNQIFGVTRTDVGGIDLSEFKTLPDRVSPVELSDRATPIARWHSLYSRGARLWWADPDTYEAAARELLPDHEAEQQRIADAQRRASFA